MNELVAKVKAVILSDMAPETKADLVIDVVARGLGKMGGRPPRTGSEPVKTGDISDPDPISGSDPDTEISAETGSKPVSKYPPAFERAWKAYPRRQEKPKALAAWKRIAGQHGGPEALADAVVRALVWQIPEWWAGDRVQFCPYFERYLKAAKWLDERITQASAPSPYRKLG